jgi:hypothetical protein
VLWPGHKVKEAQTKAYLFSFKFNSGGQALWRRG